MLKPLLCLCAFASLSFSQAFPPPGGTVTVSGNSTVVGAGAAGSAQTGNPVSISGQDLGSVSRVITTTNTGQVQIANTNTGADGVTNASKIMFIAGTGSSAFGLLGTADHWFNGATWDRPFYCSSNAPVALGSGTTQIIAASGSTQIRICQISIGLSGSGAASWKLVRGTGSNCGTGTADVTGPYQTTAAGAIFTNAGVGATSPIVLPASAAACLTVGGTGPAADGVVIYAQY